MQPQVQQTNKQSNGLKFWNNIMNDKHLSNGKNAEFALPRLNIAIYSIGNHLSDIAGQLMVDRRFVNSKVAIFSGGVDTAINYYKEHLTPDVLIIEFDSDLNSMMHDLSLLSEVCDIKTRVLIAGKTNDVQLYRELMRHGIAEYLVLPTTPTDLISVISNIFQDDQASPLAPSVAFIGAIGGVGTSIIAQSVALNLANNCNLDTIFIDLDTAYSLTNLSWSVEEAKNIGHLFQTASGYIDDALLKSCLVRISNNLNLLTSSNDPLFDLDINYEDLLSDMIKSSRILSDYTVIDIPVGRLTVEKRVALLNVTNVVIVTEPTLKGIRNLGILYDAITKIRPNDAPPFVLLNKTEFPDANHLSDKVIYDNIGISPSLSVRYISEILDLAIDRGVPASSVLGSEQFNDDILECTNLLLGKKNHTTQQRSQIDKFFLNVKKIIGL